MVSLNSAAGAACRVLVCGAGSVGRRHAENLHRLGARVMVWRERSSLLPELGREFGDYKLVGDLDDGLRQADAVVVATATDRHMPICLAAAHAGRAIYVEKPLANSPSGVDALLQIVRERHLVVEVGCQLRAHPCLRMLADRLAARLDGPIYTFRAVVGQRLDQWRPGTDFRSSYSAHATRGGGALLDLAHEIDLVRWLIGPIIAVSADARHVGEIDFPADDLANLILETQSGAVGNVQMDMLSAVYRRSLEILCRDAALEFDYVRGRLVRRSARGDETLNTLPAGFERNDMFMTMMAHFLRRVADPSVPAYCSLEHGADVLRVALAAQQSSNAGRRILLIGDVAAGGVRV